MNRPWADEFKNIRSTLVGNNVALDTLNESEKALRTALASLPQVDATSENTDNEIGNASNNVPSQPEGRNHRRAQSDPRRDSRFARTILGRIQRRLFPETFRFPETGEVIRIYSAEIATVIAGTKPLFHDQLFPTAEATQEAADAFNKTLPQGCRALAFNRSIGL